MTSPSEALMEQVDKSLASVAKTVAEAERQGCAELVQEMADTEEDPTRKDLLNDVVVAIRRMPFKKYQ